MSVINKFSESNCNKICGIISNYCTGSEISSFLKELHFHDIQNSHNLSVPITYSKTKRLSYAIMNEQLKCNDGYPLIKLIEIVYNPIRFIDANYNWNNSKIEINSVIQFLGIQLNDSGKITKSQKIETYTECEYD